MGRAPGWPPVRGPFALVGMFVARFNVRRAGALGRRWAR
jgi:hypothetical protein